eukprot:Gb_21284 [translate_table: standard]
MEVVLGVKPISIPQGHSKKKVAAYIRSANVGHCLFFVTDLSPKVASGHPLCFNGTACNAVGISRQRQRGAVAANCFDGSQFFFKKTSGLFGLHLYQARGSKRQAKCGIATCELAGAAVTDGADPSFPSSTDGSFGPKLRGFCFYAVTSILSIPLFVVMLLAHPFVLMFDRHRRKVHHLFNKLWASLTVLPFCKVDIEGLENLPAPNVPAVYVSNHQSYLDIYILLLVGRSFKFISKTSIFLIPIIGWSMFLTGHIPLHRMDKKSQMECLRRCLNVLKQGASVLFFPEGTRTKDGKMATFKKGAFTVAAKARAPVVPITLIGTGKIMPNGMESTLRKGSVKIIIHPPIIGTDAEELCDKARAVIAQRLIMHGYGVH